MTDSSSERPKCAAHAPELLGRQLSERARTVRAEAAVSRRVAHEAPRVRQQQDLKHGGKRSEIYAQCVTG